MVYGTYNELVTRAFVNQRSHHWGASHCKAITSPLGESPDVCCRMSLAQLRSGSEIVKCPMLCWWNHYGFLLVSYGFLWFPIGFLLVFYWFPMVSYGFYPLVNVYVTMERSTHFSWENPLFLWPHLVFAKHSAPWPSCDRRSTGPATKRRPRNCIGRPHGPWS